jgi:arylsulfatase A-like enzyme
MTETSIANLEDIVPNRATGYIKNSLGRFATNAYWMVPFIASAGIQTTAGELLKENGYDLTYVIKNGNSLDLDFYIPSRISVFREWRRYSHGDMIADNMEKEMTINTLSERAPV